MFLSFYRNQQQLMLAYQANLQTPVVASTPCGTTLLQFLNTNTVPEVFLQCFSDTDRMDTFHTQLVQTILQFSNHEYLYNIMHTPQTFHAMPILFRENTFSHSFQTGERYTFHMTFEYDATLGFFSIYEVHTPQEALLLECIHYQQYVHLQLLLPIKRCPQCHTFFIPKHTDTLYCSKHCIEKQFYDTKKKDPYYIKYRSLQQHYLKKIKQWSQERPESAEQFRQQYTKWQSLAKAAYTKRTEVTTRTPKEFAAQLKAIWYTMIEK